MKRLMSTVVAVMAFGLFAFADETMEEWFTEDAETVTEALAGEGETDDGVWSNLTDQVEIAEDRIVLDADDVTPVAYCPDAQLLGLRASVMLTDVSFDAARGTLPELPDGAQAAVAITTNAAGECVFAVANDRAWEMTTTTADPAADYAVRVDFTYTANGNTVDYSVSNETGWVSLKSDAVNPVAAKKISTVEFAGSGSFATFAGAYPLPPKGTEGNPWQIGAGESDDIDAWTNANGRLEISGSGKMQDFSPSAPWAGDTVTEAIVGVGVDSIGANAFASCKGLKTLVMMDEDDPPNLATGTVLEGVQIFVPAGAEWAYRTAWPTLASRIFPVYSGGEYLVSNRLYQVEYSWWDAQGANDIAEELAQFLKQAPAVSADDYFFPYRVLNWYEDVGVFNELTNRIRRLSALCTSCRTGNFIGRNFDWAYDDVEECVMRVPAADGRFASIGIASRFFPEPWQSIFGVEEFLPELTMDGINEKGVAINVNVVPAGDNGATTGTNPGGERLCAGFAVRHVLDAATNAAHAVEILESKDIYSIPFLEFHWMISDSDESYIVECVSNKLVVLRAHDAQPKMSNYYVSHSPSLCEYDVLTNADLTADFHTPHAMGIERYARVSNGLDRVDSVDAMFTNMTNVWYKLKYLPGNEGRYWSDLNGAPVPGGAEGQRFTAFDDTYELCVARSNAFKSLQANYVAVTNYEARNHSRTINPEIDPTLTNQVVHTVHTSLYDLEKRTLRVCVQEDYESQFDYALDPVWAIVSADGTRIREFASLSGALAALQDGETLMPAVAGEGDLSVKPTTFSANDFRAVPVDCPFVITNNDVTVDFRGRVLRDVSGASADDDYLVSIVGAMNVSVKNGFLFGTTWRDGYEYASEIDHRGFAVSDGARAIVSNCVVFIAATSNSVSVTEGSRLRFVNCWVDGQGDGAKEVFHAAGASRLRFVDTKGFWNPENFWGVTDGVVDTLPAITGEQFTLEDSYLCLDNTIVSNTVTHWSAGKVATPVTFSGTGNALVLTNDAFITAITGGVAVAKVELSDAGTTLDSNADFIENDEIVCGLGGTAVVKSGETGAFTYSVITSVKISLPAGISGCSYVVSNLTDWVKIKRDPGSMTGSDTYTLPIGAHVAIYCIPSKGYGVVGTNPYDIPEVTADTTVDKTKLPTVARGIEYIDENGQLQTNYTYEVVTTATTKFTSGWYAVKEDVEITGANITVDGAAHLILCDGATLTVTNVPRNKAAIDVSANGSVTNSLSIYGQTAGTGGLNAFGGEYGAGIGGSEYGSGGTLTINGGTVTATGGHAGAGIGGGDRGAGGTVMINGGAVMVTGGEYSGAGIGGGQFGVGGMVTINGGMVTATSGGYAAGIGGYEGYKMGSVVFGADFAGGILAGVDAERASLMTVDEYAQDHNAAYVTMPVAVVSIPQVNGLVYAVSNGTEEVTEFAKDGINTYAAATGDMLRVYFTLKPGCIYTKEPETNSMDVSVNDWFTMVDAALLPQVSVPAVDYLDRDGEKMVTKSVTDYTFLTAGMSALEAGRTYVVAGEVIRRGCMVVNGTLDAPTYLILCDDAKMTVTGMTKDRAALQVSAGDEVTNALVICGQAVGKGELVVTNLADYGAGIGGGSGGMVVINGGMIATMGGFCGAGIGGGHGGAGGTVTINGGTVMATGGEYGAGIGGGYEGVGGIVTVNGGAVLATGGIEDDWGGAGIGGGYYGDGGTVTVNGGTVTATGGYHAAGIGGGEGCEMGSVVFGGSFAGGVLAGVDAEHASIITTDEYEQDHSAAFVTMPAAAARVPQVTGVTYVVSNETEEVEGLYLDGVNTYVVEPGDSLKLYFVLNPECDYKKAPTANPMDLGQITGVKVVNLSELPTVNLSEVPYLDWDGETLVETNTVDYKDYRGDFTLAGGKTYVVRESMTVDVRIRVNGTVDNPTRLILCDDATLTATKGVNVSVSEDGARTNALIICGQAKGSGALVATVGDYEYGAGIGGCDTGDDGSEGAGGAIKINGGVVTATGGGTGAGIGGDYSNGGMVTINGGVVTATGGIWGGSGIGGGCLGAGDKVTINGGTVIATGGREGGAGIGGGDGGAGGTVVITGGKVTAHGTDGGEDIGHGYSSGNSGTVTISGGLFWKEPENRWTIAEGYKVIGNPDTETKEQYPYAVVPDVVPTPLMPGQVSKPYETRKEAEAAAAVTEVLPAEGFGLTGDALVRWQGYFVNQVYVGGDDSFRIVPELNAAGSNALAQAEAKLTQAIDIGAIAAATGAIEVMVLEGAEPGFYYTLFKSADVTVVLEQENHDPGNCDRKAQADGKVTFRNVTKPSDAAGFFSVRAFVKESFTMPLGE